MSKLFEFKKFTINQDKTAMKIGTDAVLLGSWCTVNTTQESILDIGSGTGIIGLMLAQRSTALQIDAVEIDESAFEQTVENFEESNWANRLFCYHAPFQEFAKEMYKEGEEYDLIISNPPFYTDTFETNNKARNTARFTSSLTFQDLVEGVSILLSKKGVFAVILPKREETVFIDLALKNKLFLNRICHIKGNPSAVVKRSLLEFSFTKNNTIAEVLTIEVNRHEYTDTYKALTSDFYLKM